MRKNPLSIPNRTLDVGGGVALLGGIFFLEALVELQMNVFQQTDWNTISKAHSDPPFCLFLPIHRPELQVATRILWPSQFGDSGRSIRRRKKKEVEYQWNRSRKQASIFFFTTYTLLLVAR